jgi:hypothetical protein
MARGTEVWYGPMTGGEYIALILALTVLLGNLVLAGVNRRKR